MKGKKSTLTKGTLVALLVAVLLLGSVVGGTIAWLTDTTDPVQNTFTTSDISITLEETVEGPFKMIPGHTIEKDPIVTVKAGSEDCYLFVKIDISDNFHDFLTGELLEDWSFLEVPAYDVADTDQDWIYPCVIYKKVLKSDADQSFGILRDNEIGVQPSVTKAMMNDLTSEADYPYITFTAYASQLMKDASNEMSVTTAWQNVAPTAP